MIVAVELLDIVWIEIPNRRSLLLGKKVTFHKWLYKAIQETANQLKIKILADFKKTQKISAYERLD